MKALIIFESMFGNTEAVARAVADGLRDTFEVELAEPGAMPPAAGRDLLVIGAPTHAFGLSRPSTRQDAARQGGTRPGTAEAGIREYLDVSPLLPNLPAAVFDTRVARPRMPGSAAHKAHRRLRRLGCRPLCPPETFWVSGTKGPLLDGELDRARAWAVRLAAAARPQRHTV